MGLLLRLVTYLPSLGDPLLFRRTFKFECCTRLFLYGATRNSFFSSMFKSGYLSAGNAIPDIFYKPLPFVGARFSGSTEILGLVVGLMAVRPNASIFYCYVVDLDGAGYCFN